MLSLNSLLFTLALEKLGLPTWCSGKKKNPPANAGDSRDSGLILGSGKSPGIVNGTLLQYFCLENSMDRAAWWACIHGIAKSQIWLRKHTLEKPYIHIPSQAVDQTLSVLRCHSIKSIIIIFWLFSDYMLCFNAIKMNDLPYNTFLVCEFSVSTTKYSYRPQFYF